MADMYQLRPTASPVNQLVRPANRQPIGDSEGMQIARSLASWSPALRDVVQAYDVGYKIDSDEARVQATADIQRAQLQNMSEFNEAVRTGVIKPSDNPWYQIQAEQELSRIEFRKIAQTAAAEYAETPEIRDSDDPEVVQAWLNQKIAPLLKDRTDLGLEAIAGMKTEFESRFLGNHLNGRVEQRAKDRILTAKTDIVGMITDLYSGAADNLPDPVVPGNIDLSRRPVVANENGTVSTVSSMSFSTPEGEVLIPTVGPNGRSLSEDEAVALYRKTGQHLGIFEDAESATAYAEAVHDSQSIGQTLRQMIEEKGATIPWPELNRLTAEAAMNAAEELENPTLARDLLMQITTKDGAPIGNIADIRRDLDIHEDRVRQKRRQRLYEERQAEDLLEDQTFSQVLSSTVSAWQALKAEDPEASILDVPVDMTQLPARVFLRISGAFDQINSRDEAVRNRSDTIALRRAFGNLIETGDKATWKQTLLAERPWLAPQIVQLESVSDQLVEVENDIETEATLARKMTDGNLTIDDVVNAAADRTLSKAGVNKWLEHAMNSEAYTKSGRKMSETEWTNYAGKRVDASLRAGYFLQNPSVLEELDAGSIEPSQINLELEERGGYIMQDIRDAVLDQADQLRGLSQAEARKAINEIVDEALNNWVGLGYDEIRKQSLKSRKPGSNNGEFMRNLAEQKRQERIQNASPQSSLQTSFPTGPETISSLNDSGFQIDSQDLWGFVNIPASDAEGSEAQAIVIAEKLGLTQAADLKRLAESLIRQRELLTMDRRRVGRDAVLRYDAEERARSMFDNDDPRGPISN